MKAGSDPSPNVWMAARMAVLAAHEGQVQAQGKVAAATRGCKAVAPRKTVDSNVAPHGVHSGAELSGEAVSVSFASSPQMDQIVVNSVRILVCQKGPSP